MKRIFTLAVLMAAAFSTCWAQVTPTLGVGYQILNANGGLALTNSNNSCILNTVDKTDPNQMWVFETASDAGYYYLKNSGNDDYLYRSTVWNNWWSMLPSSSTPDMQGEYQIQSIQSSENVNLYIKGSNTYLGANTVTAGSEVRGDQPTTGNASWQLNPLTVDELTAVRTTIINNMRTYETNNLGSFTGLTNELENDITQYNTTCTTAADVMATIAGLKTAMNTVSNAYPYAKSLKELKDKCKRLIDLTAYSGLTAFTTAYNAIGDPTTMTSSSDITTELNNLTEALRTYIQSQPASVDAPADYTPYIQHPWFCNEANTPKSNSDDDIAAAGLSASVSNGDGWIDNSSVWGHFNGWYSKREFSYDANRTKFSCWSFGLSQWCSLSVQQNLADLPNGFYTLSCDMRTGADAITNQHGYATSSINSINTPYLNTGDTWQTLSTADNGKVYVSDGKLSIGSTSNPNTNNDQTFTYNGWYLVTNFQLKYYGNILDLNEAKDYTPLAITSCGAQLKRAFTAGNWSTLCVPFSVANADIATVFGTNAQVANFTGVTLDDNNNITLNFSTTNAAITANTPCLIKLAQTADKYDVPATAFTATAPADVTFESTANSSNQKVTAVMKGTYSKIATLPTDGTAYIINGNKFYQVNSDVSLKPFRAYFTLATAAASVKALNVSVDGETTAVTGINADETPVAGNIYNLGGQQVRHNATNAASLPKGVYIKNGKKFVVK
jgi:hypothetical protein